MVHSQKKIILFHVPALFSSHPSLLLTSFSFFSLVSRVVFFGGVKRARNWAKMGSNSRGKKILDLFYRGVMRNFFPKPSRLRAIHGVRFDFGSFSIEIYYDQLWIKKNFSIFLHLNGKFLFPPTFFSLFSIFLFFFRDKEKDCWSRYFASLWPLNASMMQ